MDYNGNLYVSTRMCEDNPDQADRSARAITEVHIEWI